MMAPASVPAVKKPLWLQKAWRLLSTAPLSALFGLVVVAIYLSAAIFGPLLAPYGEAEVVSKIPFAPWSHEFLLGTDQLGRDTFSRLLFGARNTLGISIATVCLSFGVGVVLGMATVIRGGWTDRLLLSLTDALMAIPPLIFALILLSIAGSSIPSLIVAIAAVDMTRIFRLTRSLSANVLATDFVEAARLRGEGLSWIMFREVLPNILPLLVAEFGLRFCFVFLSISALAFLGLGIQPPTADWGSMVRESAALISYADITPLIPAAAIGLLTVAVNFVVDWILHMSSGLRDDERRRL
ncbi:ABC transporter permease [Mesorhizobium sp. AR10]|uniref:ABC transporter permease n=1 Tax=Mesorhizobium sp. AR10 TaxID=2865839 RepID=UPI00215FD578|nr:ABC transporter permease [Mesorhizobium sp. AR10]